MIPTPPKGFKLDNAPTPPPGFVLDESIPAPPTGFSLDTDLPKPPDGFKIDAPDKFDYLSSGMGVFPSMPEKRPAIIPSPLEQVKVHGMVSALPSPISEEVKKAAIEKQREKQFGVYKNPSLIPNPITAISNMPANFEDIVKSTGSLLMNVALMAKNAVLNRDALDEQLKPAVELTGAIKKDWQSMFAGKPPSEISKTTAGKGMTKAFETVERQGILRTLSKFVEDRPLDSLLITQALKSAVGSGIRVTAETAQKVIPRGTRIADKLDSFLSTERTPIVFELPAESQVPKTAEEIAAKTPVSVAKKVTAPLKGEKGEVALKLPPEETPSVAEIKTKAPEGESALIEEARKYPSAEEFVRAKFAKEGTDRMGNTTALQYMNKTNQDFFREKYTDFWNKANEGKVSGNPLDYGSAEEFVKAQGEPVYHGTDATFDSFDLNKSKAFGQSKFGHWFQEKSENLNVYGKNTVEAFVDVKNPKVIGYAEWNKIRDAHAKDGEWFKSWKEKLVAEGYDGLKVKASKEMFAGEKMENPAIVAAFNDSQVKTKSQLTDIWNKAQEAKLEGKQQLIFKDEIISGTDNNNVKTNFRIISAEPIQGNPSLDTLIDFAKQQGLKPAEADAFFMLVRGGEIYRPAQEFVGKDFKGSKGINADKIKEAYTEFRKTQELAPDLGKAQPDTLITEARKYKSAEEFVNNKNVDVPENINNLVLAHNTTSMAKGSIVNGGFTTEKFGETSKLYKQDYKKDPIGVSFTTTDKPLNPENVSWRGKGTTETVYSVADVKKPLIVDFDGWKDTLHQEYKTNGNGKALTNKLIKQGYDSIITKFEDGSTHEIIILQTKILKNFRTFEEAQIQSKSQLTDIWNKANEGKAADVPKLPPPPEGFTLDTGKFVPTKPVATAEKVIEFPRQYSKDPFTKYIFQKSFDKTLEFFPRAKKALAEHKAEGLINKLRDTYDKANFQQRVTLNTEVLKQIETLSKEEQAIMVPYLEGRASLINDSSEAFKKFETYYRDLSDTIQKDLAAMGKLEPKQIKARLYQPLEKATGKTADEIIAEFGDFVPAYVHHTFPQKFTQKMGDFFADTTGKRFKPGFLKRSYGVSGYTEDLKEILPKWTAQYVKLKNTEAFLNDFTGKFGIPVNVGKIKEVTGGYQVGDKVYRGYKIVAPDNFLSFYKGKIDFYKEVSKRLEGMDIDEAIGDALANALQGAEKSFVGVSKNKQVFLVPDKIVKNLESYANPLFGSQKAHNSIKLYYDKPQQFWKDSVLAVSPRWVKNNVLGDVIFNTMEGVGALSYSRSFMSKYHDIIPDELLRASFANVMKYNPKLGLAAKSTVGQLAETIGQTPLVRGVSKVKDVGYALNTMFEQPFVRALYVKLAREKAIELLKAEKAVINNENIMAKLAEMKANPALAEPIISKIEKTLPVFDLTGNLERKYLKRLMPFYNWYKFMAKYTATLPINHPFKTVGARGLGALSELQREQAFIQMFPYMKREIEDSGIPDRFDNLWPVKSPDAEGKAMFFNSRGFNVFTTVEDMTKGNILNLMSPLVKMPVERATGREAFSGREYKTGEGGLEFKGREKQLPPLGEHILSQFPQHGLIKQTLVPARQYDTGTILNPDPILDKITGEYKYPIESVEKWLNLIGVDKKTLDVREAWDAYQKQKAIAIGETFTKYQSKADTALTLNDIKEIFTGIKKDPARWQALIGEIKGNVQQTAMEKKALAVKIKKGVQP